MNTGNGQEASRRLVGILWCGFDERDTWLCSCMGCVGLGSVLLIRCGFYRFDVCDFIVFDLHLAFEKRTKYLARARLHIHGWEGSLVGLGRIGSGWAGLQWEVRLKVIKTCDDATGLD